MEGDNKTRRLQIHTGTMEKYNPSRALREEQKRIEVELWQKRNRLLWKRMENNSRKTEEELERKREFHRVIKKSERSQKGTTPGQAVTHNNHKNKMK